MRHTKQMKEQYRERLKKIIGTKIQTTMVFPVSQFEASFGHLWGHGKPEDSLTNEEKMWRAKWKECRDNIFNNGNQQKRNAFAEIDMYEVVWNAYTTIFLPPDKMPGASKQVEEKTDGTNKEQE